MKWLKKASYFLPWIIKIKPTFFSIKLPYFILLFNSTFADYELKYFNKTQTWVRVFEEGLGLEPESEYPIPTSNKKIINLFYLKSTKILNFRFFLFIIIISKFLISSPSPSLKSWVPTFGALTVIGDLPRLGNFPICVKAYLL